MSSEEIRQKFLEFFKKRGHAIVSSSSLLPDDPSVLLTTAGMQQFKKYFTGELNASSDFGSQRTVSIQKSFRTSDIEEVGDKTHLTFFEMLGNFSFPYFSREPQASGGKIEDPASEAWRGGTEPYFKRSAIFWAYEFITEVMAISPERLTVSVFEGDSDVPFDGESYKIWNEEIGVSKDKIILSGRQDNFWGPTGDEGPCGPTTEIYVDGVEIWNLVFNQYYKEKNLPAHAYRQAGDRQGGTLRKLENPGVDTGMGMERLTAVVQGVENIFETDLFQPLLSKLNELAPTLDDRVARIFADHLRGIVFLIADGIMPSNKEAGYVLRRLLRRIFAYRIQYDVHADVFPQCFEILKNQFGGFYPEINDFKKILEIAENEYQKFNKAVGLGLKEIGAYKEITAKDAFYFYETFGLPYELVKELKPEAAKNLSFENFNKEFEKHREVSRVGAEKKFGGHGLLLDTGELKASNEEEVKKVIGLHTATHLLHWALREILGGGIRQMGSDISAERARFDFSFDRKLSSEEIMKIEELVNEKIKKDLPVYFKEMPKGEAEKTGALSFFKAKYPDNVRVYFIGSEASGGIISKEFCGGPHVENTREIGEFKILKEEAVAAGVRRIRVKIS
ncbi:alanine--tRNA ligase [Candidatus Wolfebacteria bacterium]|nr:alanine--tRNA ligase [Candidatus Wolfebacteria bacterium]